MLVDRFGRHVNYMRISVTDRCNLRCSYCMPAEGAPLFKGQTILTYEQIEAVVKMAVRLGINRFRFTGGEPLVRREVVPFMGRIKRTAGVLSVAMTTNGLLLERHAEDLARAGVDRINLSLDSFDRETFRTLTRRDALPAVLRGLKAAMALDSFLIKINCVLIRGVNDREIPAFLEQTLELPLHVRFIEFMPSGSWEGQAERVVSAGEIIQVIERQGFLPDQGPPGNGPARYWRHPKGLGTAGIISPVTNRFCESCNRIRLNAKGELRACLLDEGMVSLRASLDREDSSEVRELFLRVIQQKPERHHDLRSFHMSTIGG